MIRRARGQGWTVLAVAVTVAIGALALGGPASSPSAASVSRPPHATTGASTSPAGTPRGPTVTAELAELARAGVVSAPTSGGPEKTPEKVADLTDAPGMPTCAPPPIPAATYPPGNSYGIPFLAAITNGQVLAGYDEWTANHLTWRAQGTTYDLDPWEAKIYDITGWVTGLLELPSLSADIPPQDIVFCDQGGAACVSADWPAGQCIHILSQYGPEPGSPVPPPGIGNDHPEGTACTGYSTPTFACLPLVVSLTPSGDTDLTVSGVESDGALDLSVTTAATTTVSEIAPSPAPVFTCEDDPATITLSTVAPTGLPATAPLAPNPPNTDERSLQTAPQALTGALASGSATVGSNAFAIPAFFPSAGGSPCSPTVAELVNTYAGGFDSVFKDQNEGNYYLEGGTNPTAAAPGWAQFTATATVVTLGSPTSLPVGPPAGFSF
jgi:hypothetical protein